MVKGLDPSPDVSMIKKRPSFVKDLQVSPLSAPKSLRVAISVTCDRADPPEVLAIMTHTTAGASLRLTLCRTAV